MSVNTISTLNASASEILGGSSVTFEQSGGQNKKIE